MTHSMITVLSLLLALCGMCIPCRADELNQQAEHLFVRRIAPLLSGKCVACHGKDASDLKGDFDLRSLASLLQGGESGKPGLVPGNPEKSPLYLVVIRQHEDWSPMPPKEADQLSEQQVQWIRDWIAGGAPWPDETRAREIAIANANQWAAEDGVEVKTSGGLSPDWTHRKYKGEDLWAYQPVIKPTPPDTAVHPIDAFLLAKLPAGLLVAPRADRVTLIRRATFDLTGLPPSPEDVEAYVKDPGSDDEAFARVIERVLNSPHYGERMAQHWLDVTRYADTAGFANDYDRGNAWRYRDYVVRSFNSDKSYDQFVREQIAGDEIDADNPEMLVATGFLRMGPWELTGMEVAKVARQRFLDDVTNSVGETFLAHSLQCARCHDHKFDPIPTRDYYSIQAVFATTQLSERAAPFLPSENIVGFEEKQYLEMRRLDYLKVLARLDDQLLEAAQKWFRENAIDPTGWNAAVAKVVEESSKGKSKRTPREFKDVFNAVRNVMKKDGVAEDQYPPKLVGFSPEDYGNERVARKGLERLRWELDRYEPFALAVYNGRTPQVTSVSAPVRMPENRLTAGELEQTCILAGGDPFASGDPVTPGVLSVTSASGVHIIPEDIEGRRLKFSEWLTSPNNPLTARVIMNRLWLWHFGKPIAGNPNNFGGTGKKPTHPELLDWLAATFIEEGWSIKAIHRHIMTSDAWRRSTLHPDRTLLADKDPEGTSYAAFRPRRLSAEELRDAMLAATGELNPEVGGIPNRPEINLEAALQPRQVMGTFAAAWTPNPIPQQRHRRSLYALKIRGLPDPLLEVFNTPSPDCSCECRETSTVTPQVFSLFNGQASYSRALALANRAVKETDSDDQAITLCFQLAFSRSPRADELQSCLDHWRETESLQGHTPTVHAEPQLKVRREAVEENTGEKFSFDENLHANRDFVPDLQRADVSAHTRALADLCLVLLNSNEFAYVY